MQTETQTEAINIFPWYLKWLPIILIECWLTLTIVLFFCGPWVFPEISNAGTLLCYVLVGQGFIFAGYYSAKNYSPKKWGVGQKTEHRFAPMSVILDVLYSPEKFVCLCALIVLIMEIIRIALYQCGPLDVLYYMFNPGLAYRRTLDLRPTSLPSLVVMIYYPFRNAFLPVACVFWSQLSKKCKLLAISALMAMLSFNFCIGINMALLAIVVPIALFSWIGFLRQKKIKIRNVCGYALLLLVLFSFFFAYFHKGSQQRWGATEPIRSIKVEKHGFDLKPYSAEAAAKVDETERKLIAANTPPKEMKLSPSVLSNLSTLPEESKLDLIEDNFLWKKITKKIYECYFSLARYACGGYYGLSLALTCEWKPTYGFGTAIWTLRALDIFFPDNSITRRSYPYQVEEKYAYPVYIFWHTIYPFLASDFSFVGALFFVGLMGRYFAMTWFETLKQSNVLAPVLSYQLLIGLVFVCANNQLLQSTVDWMSFVPLFIVWFFLGNRQQKSDIRSGDVGEYTSIPG